MSHRDFGKEDGRYCKSPRNSGGWPDAYLMGSRLVFLAQIIWQEGRILKADDDDEGATRGPHDTDSKVMSKENTIL